jgi:hypothetical protein
VPIGAVARQTRYFQSHHDARVAEAHLGNQLLEALALSCRSSRLTLVAINNLNVLGMPAQDNRPLTQRILTLRALGIFKYLTRVSTAECRDRPSSSNAQG